MLIDLLEPFNLRRIVEVVRESVVGVGYSDGAVGAIATLAAHHQGNDPSHVGLESNGHQVEHQVAMLFKSRRDSAGALECGDEAVADFLTLDSLNAFLDFANGRKVLIHLSLVGCAQVHAETPGVFTDEVQNATILTSKAGAFRRIGGVAI